MGRNFLPIFNMSDENFDKLFDRSSSKSIRLIDMYRESPVVALEYVLQQALVKNFNKSAFLWVSSTGIDGVRYGRFRNVDHDLLRGRTYNIEYWDGMVSIHFTDVKFNPKNRIYVSNA